MSNDLFNDPAKGGNFDAATHKGRLLLITPTEYVEEIKTVHGPKDAVKANIVVVDETNPVASESVPDAYLFGGYLIGATKAFVGKGMVLGRLDQGAAKPGQNAPWILTQATDAEKDKARAYIASVAPAL